jgi:hypothetical protein
MDTRMGVLVGLLCVTACAGIEPVGRGVTGAPASPAELRTDDGEVARPDAPAIQPPVVAFEVAPPAAPAPRRSGEDEVVIPSQTQRQIPPPDGDPRSRLERREDVRAWDQCVTNVQGAFDSDPMGPQLQSPEEVCRTALGMAARDAVPDSRRR